jgi:hypothetical protein
MSDETLPPEHWSWPLDPAVRMPAGIATTP